MIGLKYVKMESKHCIVWTKKLTNLPRFSVVNITNYIIKHGTDRTSDRGYEFYVEEFIHEVFAAEDTQNKTFNLKAKCWRSYLKREKPHDVNVQISALNRNVESASCSCIAG